MRSVEIPQATQEALADFVREGDLLRHIRKMRRSYKLKYEAMIDAIESEFNGDLEVISQAADCMWQPSNGVVAFLNMNGAKELNSTILLFDHFSFYEYGSSVEKERDWSGALLGLRIFVWQK